MCFSIRMMFNCVLFDDTCMGVFETLLSVFLEFDFHLSLCFMEFNLSSLEWLVMFLGICLDWNACPFFAFTIFVLLVRIHDP